MKEKNNKNKKSIQQKSNKYSKRYQNKTSKVIRSILISIIIIIILVITFFVLNDKRIKYYENSINYYTDYTDKYYTDFMNLNNKYNKYDMYIKYLNDYESYKNGRDKFPEVISLYEEHLPHMRKYFIDYYIEEIGNVITAKDENRLNLKDSNNKLELIMDEIKSDNIANQEEIDQFLKLISDKENKILTNIEDLNNEFYNQLLEEIDNLILDENEDNSNLENINIINNEEEGVESYNDNSNYAENSDLLLAKIEGYQDIMNRINSDKLISDEQKGDYINYIQNKIDICNTKLDSLDKAVANSEKAKADEERQQEQEEKQQEYQNKMEELKLHTNKIYVYTDENGNKWEAPQKVNDLYYLSKHEFEPMIYDDQQTGTLNIVWFDKTDNVSYDSNGEKLK